MSKVPLPLLILIVTFMTIGTQLILKKAVGNIAGILKDSGVVPFLLAAVSSPYILLALALQATGYVLWMIVLTGERLSIAFAISGSFFYIVMAGASWYFLGERLSFAQWAGLVLITCGVVLVTLSPTAQQ